MAKLIQRKLSVAPEVVMLHNPRSMPAERFRRLKTLLAQHRDSDLQTIVITSGAPGEGKSLVALNLALCFAAERTDEVLLIDADLRRPSQQAWLTPPPNLGLSEVLTGRTEIEHAILQLQNSPLKILPAGEPPHDPVEILSSEGARGLLKDLRSQFKRIIIDTPPIVPFTDADVISASADGVLLVARAGVTRKAVFSRASESVTAAPIVGTVLNDVTFNLADRESYYMYQSNYGDYNRGRDDES